MRTASTLITSAPVVASRRRNSRTRPPRAAPKMARKYGRMNTLAAAATSAIVLCRCGFHFSLGGFLLAGSGGGHAWTGSCRGSSWEEGGVAAATSWSFRRPGTALTPRSGQIFHNVQSQAKQVDQAGAPRSAPPAERPSPRHGPEDNGRRAFTWSEPRTVPGASNDSGSALTAVALATLPQQHEGRR
jgi:hypothetical protein